MSKRDYDDYEEFQEYKKYKNSKRHGFGSGFGGLSL